MLLVSAVVVLFESGWIVRAVYVAHAREAIAAANSGAAEAIQKRAVAFRFAHPLSCPAPKDLVTSNEGDWVSSYVIECTDSTLVRSAGPDGVDFTPDDIHYP